jgi:hypothetical protein
MTARRHPTQAEQFAMVRAYQEGRSLQAAAGLHGFSALACRTALQKFGVPRRTRSAAQRARRPSRPT